MRSEGTNPIDWQHIQRYDFHDPIVWTTIQNSPDRLFPSSALPGARPSNPAVRPHRVHGSGGICQYPASRRVVDHGIQLDGAARGVHQLGVHPRTAQQSSQPNGGATNGLCR